MMKSTRFSSITLFGLMSMTITVGLAGCDEESVDASHGDHGDHGDHGGELVPDQYEEGGITKMTDDGHFLVTLVSAPEPPAKGFNAWTLKVMEPSDRNLVVGANVMIEPWMPDHGHGSNSDAVVEARGEGEYLAESVELHMLGLWDTTVSIDHGDTSDTVHFIFMVE